MILNYIGSQWLVLERCSEPGVVMCLDHSGAKQAAKLSQLLVRAAAQGPAGAPSSSSTALPLGCTMRVAQRPYDGLWSVLP